MNEIERVAQMVADGRITAEEGDRLITVLKSVQSADEELEETRAQLEDLPQAAEAVALAATPAATPASTPSPAPARAPLPPLEAGAAAPEAAAAPHVQSENGEPQRGYAPAGTKWVRVELMAGDLEVTMDPSLSAPTASSDSGDIRLEATEYGYRLASRTGQGALGGMFGKLRAGDFKVALPSGYGVELANMVGDIELTGVPYLRGTLTAGDIDAHGLLGVDFTTLAGDVFVSLTPQSGRHCVRAKVGEIEVVLLPGSDVSVKGSVSMGDITASEPFTTERNLVSERVSGTLGTGRATLELSVTAGSITVRSGGEHE